MKKICFICDRCKQDITEHPIMMIMESVDHDTGEFKYDSPYPDMEDVHFCKDCAAFFAGLIKRHCKKGAPAIINQDFENAVQDMIATSQPEGETDPPPRWTSRNADWTVGRYGR